MIKEQYHSSMFRGFLARQGLASLTLLHYIMCVIKQNKPTCSSTGKRIFDFYNQPLNPLSAIKFLNLTSGDVPTEKVRILRQFEELIQRRGYNFFGTITNRKTKTETKFRNLIYGQHFIEDYFDLRNSQIISEAKGLLKYSDENINEDNYWFEQPSFFTQKNFLQETLINNKASQKRIKAYQDRLESNKTLIGEGWFEYGIYKMAKASNVESFAIFIEYGKKNGEIHAHILLAHKDTQNVREHRFKHKNKISLIPTEDHDLYSFFQKISKIGKSQLELIDNRLASIKYVTKYVLKDIYIQASNQNYTALTEETVKKYKGQFQYNPKSYNNPIYEKKVENPLYMIKDLNGLMKKPEINKIYNWQPEGGILKGSNWKNYNYQKSLQLNES
jgi:hypothetical protein